MDTLLHCIRLTFEVVVACLMISLALAVAHAIDQQQPVSAWLYVIPLVMLGTGLGTLIHAAITSNPE